MKLSIIIPCFNEKKTISRLIEKVLAVKLKGIKKEIIVVNDGSQDGTLDVLNKIKFKEVKIVNLKTNLGKGAAIRRGIRCVTGKIVLIQDADLEYNPQDYKKLLKPFIESKAKVVYGSREIGKDKRSYSYLSFYLGGLILTKISNFLYGINLTDEPTGYKLFETKLLKSLKLESRGFEFCPEVTAKVSKKGILIKEVPISYEPRLKNEGKKIRWTDGLIAIWTLVKYKFVD